MEAFFFRTYNCLSDRLTGKINNAAQSSESKQHLWGTHTPDHPSMYCMRKQATKQVTRGRVAGFK